jgi:hypothetical protein
MAATCEEGASGKQSLPVGPLQKMPFGEIGGAYERRQKSSPKA